jgi:hypothetical protein
MGVSKGQMFVLTVIFLMGSVFAVQQILFSYASTDFAADSGNDDFYVLKTVRDAAAATVALSPDCANVSGSLAEFEGFLRTGAVGGFLVTADHDLECANWGNSPPAPAPVTLTVYVKGRGLDTLATYELYH